MGQPRTTDKWHVNQLQNRVFTFYAILNPFQPLRSTFLDFSTNELGKRLIFQENTKTNRELFRDKFYVAYQLRIIISRRNNSIIKMLLRREIRKVKGSSYFFHITFCCQLSVYFDEETISTCSTNLSFVKTESFVSRRRLWSFERENNKMMKLRSKWYVYVLLSLYIGTFLFAFTCTVQL